MFPVSRRKEKTRLGIPRNPVVRRSQVTARSEAFEVSSRPNKALVGTDHGCSEPLVASKRAMKSRVLKTPSEPAALRNLPPANTVASSQEKARVHTTLSALGLHTVSNSPEGLIAARFLRPLPSTVLNV